MNKTISIIIPVYNGEKYLKRCIDSIINQTYSNLEIIVVNDGSTDNSKSILEEYAKIDKRIILINKENGGVSSARNIGLENVTGDFIAFVDSDDYLEFNMYEKLIDTIYKNNSDVAICNIIYENKNQIKTEEYNVKVLNFERNDYPKISFYTQNISGYVWNRLYTRKLIYNDNGSFIKFDTSIFVGEDNLYNYEVFNNNKNIKYSATNEKLYHYVVNNESVTNSNFNLKKLSYFSVREKEINMLNLNNIDANFLKADYIINFIRTMIVMEKLNLDKNDTFYNIQSKAKKYKKELSLKRLNFNLKVKLLIATKLKFIYKYKLRNVNN